MSLVRNQVLLVLGSVLFSAVSIHGEIDKSDLLSLESKTVYAPIGQSVNLLARATEGRAIQFCRWDAVNNSKVGNNGIIFVNEVDELPSTSIIAIQSADKNSRQIQGYDSYGDGLTNGECGITIQNVTRADITTWKYLLIEFSKVDGNPNAVTRDVQVERAVPPARPVISDKQLLENVMESGTANQKVVISCCAQDGVPNPRLHFQFDNTSLPASSSEGTLDSDGFCIHWDATFTRLENGKKLKCISEHLTFGNGQEEDFVDVNVSYMPELLTKITHPDNSTIHLLLSAEENYVTVQYAACPQPEVEWYVREEVTGKFVDVALQKFAVRMTNPKPYIWESLLKLNAETANSSQTTFKVIATNKAGTVEVIVLVTKNINHPLPLNPRSPWYWLLVPLIAFLVVIVLLVIFVILGRSNGWCCWKKNVRSYSIQGRNVVYDPVLSTTV